MDFKKYYIKAGLMAFLVSPLTASYGFIFSGSGNILFIGPTITLALIWIAFSRTATFPGHASKVFLPLFMAYGYYMFVWVILFSLSNYHFAILSKSPFFWLTIPFFFINFIFSISGDFSAFPLIVAAIALVSMATMAITCAFCKKRIVLDRKVVIFGLIFATLCGIAAFQHYDRGRKILGRDYQVEQIQDEVNIYDYQPFSQTAKDYGTLQQLDEPATISITADYPKLDGATAAAPVYAAMVQEIYKGLNANTVEDYVTCSKTDVAYQRLIDGEIDIFFGAQPSKQQIAAAKEQGIELVLHPIAKEAFVFFVNSDNPVTSLTIGQIQDIYQKKVTKWSAVGGNDESIMPFQRPENSGSQTIMLAMVMRDKPLPAPLFEEYAAGMGGIISRVATYRNYSSAIGYSFRYFATGMKPNEQIRLLAIDGIEPTVEHIRNGTYPFTVDVYAVTAGSTNANTQKLIDWVLSAQGQDFIEQCGYVKN